MKVRHFKIKNYHNSKEFIYIKKTQTTQVISNSNLELNTQILV
jgi:hypothetical protein